MTPNLPILLSDIQKPIYWKLCRLLSRSELTGVQQLKLKELISDSAEFLPLPFQPSLAPIYPLVYHHLEQAEVEFETVFDTGTMELRHPAELIPSLLQREKAFHEFLQATEDHQVPVMLIKGATLRPRYTSPVLRTSSDYDLVVSVKVASKMDRLLRSQQWIQQRSPMGKILSVYRHQSGALIDLHRAQSKLAKRIMQNARPFIHGTYNTVKEPSPSDHLVIIALHNAGHGSKKVFRDLADSRILLKRQPIQRVITQIEQLPLSQTQKQAAQGFLSLISPSIRIIPATKKTEQFNKFYQSLAFSSLPSQVFERLQPLVLHPSLFGLLLLVMKDLRNMYFQKQGVRTNFDEWFQPSRQGKVFSHSKLGRLLLRSKNWPSTRVLFRTTQKLPDVEKIW